MVKVADTLEGVQSGIIDVGGFCFCFEPSNLPLHAFQAMLRGDRIDGRAPHAIATRGLAWVPEDRRVFGSLSVEENIRVAALASGLVKLEPTSPGLSQRKPGWRRQRPNGGSMKSSRKQRRQRTRLDGALRSLRFG